MDKENLLRSLLKIDSSIRAGEFLYAYREANKTLSEINKEFYKTQDLFLQELASSIRKTCVYLRPLVKPYSQNQSSIEVVKRNLFKKNEQNTKKN